MIYNEHLTNGIIGQKESRKNLNRAFKNQQKRKKSNLTVSEPANIEQFIRKVVKNG